MKPNEQLRVVMREAYSPCQYFGRCKEAVWALRIPAMMTGRSAEGDRFAHPFLTGVDFLLGPVTFRQG